MPKKSKKKKLLNSLGKLKQKHNKKHCARSGLLEKRSNLLVEIEDLRAKLTQAQKDRLTEQ